MIFIVQSLSADPQSLQLPGSIRLRQILQSDQANEAVLIEYRLASAHNIWFDEGGPPTKSVTFPEEVESGGTTLRHDVRLIATPGAPSLPGIQIEEVITDSAGKKQSTIILVGVS